MSFEQMQELKKYMEENHTKALNIKDCYEKHLTKLQVPMFNNNMNQRPLGLYKTLQ